MKLVENKVKPKQGREILHIFLGYLRVVLIRDVFRNALFSNRSLICLNLISISNCVAMVFIGIFIVYKLKISYDKRTYVHGYEFLESGKQREIF